MSSEILLFRSEKVRLKLDELLELEDGSLELVLKLRFNSLYVVGPVTKCNEKRIRNISVAFVTSFSTEARCTCLD